MLTREMDRLCKLEMSSSLPTMPIVAATNEAIERAAQALARG
jgi:hypothetical protein